jgi:extradiol dioxygenase family protein
MPDPILHLSLPVRDLDEARNFYIKALGCRPGRTRDDWCDVWFFGLQLTLQERPEEVRSPDQQGVLHFGVVVPDESQFRDVVRLATTFGATWIRTPELHTDPQFSGKLSGKLTDPSGNVIEIKWYRDTTDFLAE